jgi:glycosyltransferase involved in cell wall biosynthesis
MLGGFSPNDLLLTVYAKLLGFPVIIRLRAGMGREYHAKWELLPFPLNQFYRLQLFFCRHYVLTRANGILTVSWFLRNQIVQYTEIDPEKILTVYNPVDIDAFSKANAGNLRSKLQIPENAGIILTVTNFNYYKKYTGVCYYMPAIIQTLQEHPQWYFVIIGDGYLFKQGRKKILQLLPDDVKDRCIFAGYFSPIEDAFKDADVAVHLSFHDAAPNVVFEAQAAGKPIIVNDLGGSPELLLTKYTVPNCVIREASELYQSLTTFINDKQLREQIGQKNFNAIKHFKFESVGAILHKSIISLIEQKVRSIGN